MGRSVVEGARCLGRVEGMVESVEGRERVLR